MAATRPSHAMLSSLVPTTTDYPYFLLPLLVGSSSSSTSTTSPCSYYNYDNCTSQHEYYSYPKILSQYDEMWPGAVTTTLLPSTTSTYTSSLLGGNAAAAAAARRRLVSNPLAATSAARLSALEARWLATTTATTVAAAAAAAAAGAPSLSPLLRNSGATTAMQQQHHSSTTIEDLKNLINSNDAASLLSPERSPTFVTIFVTLYMIEFIIGFIGNLAVMIVIARQTNMHNVTNFFIANMALADVLLATLSLPLTPHFTLTGEWVFGRILCHVMPFVQGTAYFACTLTLMNIAIDRWRNVCQPLQPRMNNSTCATIIAATWIFSALVCLPYGILMKVEYPNDDDAAMCAENWPQAVSEGVRLIFGTTVLVLQYIVPLLVISICYILIWARLKQRPRFASASGERERRELQRQNRLQTMLSLMVIFFAISWLPLNAMNVTFDYYTPSRSWQHANMLFLACHVVAMSSICYNPILYAGLNETFRNGLRKLLGFAPSSPNASIGSGTRIGGGNTGVGVGVIGGDAVSGVVPPASHFSRINSLKPPSLSTVGSSNNNRLGSVVQLLESSSSSGLMVQYHAAATNNGGAHENMLDIIQQFDEEKQPLAPPKSYAARLATNTNSKNTKHHMDENNNNNVIVEVQPHNVASAVLNKKNHPKKSMLLKQQKQSNFSTTTNTTLVSFTPPPGDITRPSFATIATPPQAEHIRLLPLRNSNNNNNVGDDVISAERRAGGDEQRSITPDFSIVDGAAPPQRPQQRLQPHIFSRAYENDDEDEEVEKFNSRPYSMNNLTTSMSQPVYLSYLSGSSSSGVGNVVTQVGDSEDTVKTSRRSKNDGIANLNSTKTFV